MRVVSLNTWGGRLFDGLAEFLPRIAADILCLQEIVQVAGPAPDWLDYRDDGIVLPQRARLFDEIAAMLPDHAGVFCTSATGPLWHGDRPVASLWGLATFVRKSLPVVAQTQAFIHGAYDPAGFGQHPRARSAHAVRVFDTASGTFHTVVNLHGLRDLAGKHDTPARMAQAERIAALVRTVALPGDGLIVCGDFNVLPGSATFAVLGALGLVDLVTARGHPTTRTAHYRGTVRFADYMLVGEGLRQARFDVLAGVAASDHAPLVLDI